MLFMTSRQNTHASPLPLALTQGDPSGIGPELALRAWLSRQPASRPFFILANPAHLSKLARQLGWDVAVAIVEPHEAARIFATALPVVALDATVTGSPGQPIAADAASTIESITRAVGYVHRGEAAAVVTCPIAKHVLYQAGFAHPGHTEFLGELAANLWGVPATPVMMLWTPELAVVPVTVHIALAQVPARLTTRLITDTARIVARDLARLFGITRPRLAIAGLNPHAGEGGAMGLEEQAIIMPAIAQLQADGIAVTGPHPADTLFHAAARKNYDVVLAMYHDQALIPIKTIAFDHAVNITLGLPFIRTSPDHGTAFDIAGRGIADPASLLAALALAAQLA